ncbi:MAG TPA: hypothetical protein VF895_05225 [Gaiellaceae bacterium]
MTLIGAGLAGLLVWIGTQIDAGTTGGYWAVYGLIAGAGLVMALSQLLGGWTKWGWPRVSLHVFLVGFLPVLIAVGWVVLAAQPHANWFQSHINSWSGSIGLGGLVGDLKEYVAVLAFGLGLVFGFVFDTTGPRTEPLLRRRRPAAEPAAPPAAVATDGGTAIERRRATPEAGAPVARHRMRLRRRERQAETSRRT